MTTLAPQTSASRFNQLFPALDSCSIAQLGPRFMDLIDSIDPETLFDMSDDNRIILIFSDGSTAAVAGPELA